MLVDNETKIQISTLAQILDLSQFVIEKDVYVTQAISSVNKLKHDMFDLVFQGGTSLAKAHRIIERMSEDCDFRIRQHDESLNLSKEARRRILRDFRHELIAVLRKDGFIIQDSHIRVRNEGQFMAIKAEYPSQFTVTSGIKPFIALEFFLGDVKIIPDSRSVTTMIKQFFGDEISHPVCQINSVNITETAAEKWVSLTRRVATSTHRAHYRDVNLVRHLYDLYQIKTQNQLGNKFTTLAGQIILDDRKQYKNHNNDYYKDPISEIKRAVDELSSSAEWLNNWHLFIDNMVYAKSKPSFQNTIDNLVFLTDLVLDSIDPNSLSGK